MQTPPQPRNRLQQAQMQGQPQPQPQPPQAAPVAPPGQPAANDDHLQEEMASPEEQAQYEALVGTAVQLLYEGPALEQALNLFKQGAAEGFPHVMALIVTTILDQLEQEAGGQIDDEMLMAIGEELLTVIATDVEELGIMPVSDDMLQESVSVTLAAWMQQHPERVDPEAVRALAPQGQQPQPQQAPAQPQQAPAQPAPARGILA